jgi:hypothetical protein
MATGVKKDAFYLPLTVDFQFKKLKLGIFTEF